MSLLGLWRRLKAGCVMKRYYHPPFGQKLLVLSSPCDLCLGTSSPVAWLCSLSLGLF